MKITRLLVLILIIVVAVMSCVACNGDDKTTTRRTTNKNNSQTATCKGDHTVTEWTVEREASCRVPLKEVGVCDVCGEEVERKGEKLDHDWGEDILEESTCLVAGAISRQCSMCQEEELIEELPLAEHDFTNVTDKSGKYVKSDCSTCGTSYIKAVAEANDLFNWATNEVAYEALDVYDDNFAIEMKSLQFFQGADSNNHIVAMTDDRENCYFFVKDKNNILKNEDAFVFQFDIMFEAFPAGGTSTLACLYHDGNDYAFFLHLNEDGYLCITDERCYETPIKTGKLELNTWHNIAVVVYLGDAYKATVDQLIEKGVSNPTKDEDFYRLPYQVYLDGNKLDLVAQLDGSEYTTEFGGAYWGTKSIAESESFVIRLFDGGRKKGITYDVAIDNFRVYSGTTVKEAMRGEIDFGGTVGKITVDYPCPIIWP